MKNYLLGLTYHSVLKRAERDIWREFESTRTELELLSALASLIIESGRIYHNIEHIMRRALKPFKSAQFYAAYHSLKEKGQIIQKPSKSDVHSYTLSLESLTIVERLDMRICELVGESLIKQNQKKTIPEILEGKLN